MPALIVAFFNFFSWSKVVDFVFSYLKFSSMVAVNAILMTFMIAYFSALLYSLNFIYEKINYIISYINNFPVSDSISSLAFSLVKSLGIWAALCDVTSVFFPIIGSTIVVYGLKLGVVIFKNSRAVLLSLFISKL